MSKKKTKVGKFLKKTFSGRKGGKGYGRGGTKHVEKRTLFGSKKVTRDYDPETGDWVETKHKYKPSGELRKTKTKRVSVGRAGKTTTTRTKTKVGHGFTRKHKATKKVFYPGDQSGTGKVSRSSISYKSPRGVRIGKDRSPERIRSRGYGFGEWHESMPESYRSEKKKTVGFGHGGRLPSSDNSLDYTNKNQQS